MRSTAFQPLWSRLAHLSRIGMNYWGGAGLYDSGEITVMRYVKRKLSNEAITIFDVGANKGQYVLAAAQVFDGSEKIFCFEPSRFTYDRLSETVAGAGLGSRVHCYHLGFGEKADVATLYAHQEGTVIASLYRESVFTSETETMTAEEIRIESIDNFCRAQMIGRIHFLKLDVEGHEYFALKGARQMIEEERIDFIQFEFGEFHIEARTYFRDFFDMLTRGYRLYRIVSNGLVEIKQYNPELEVFLTANYLAERKALRA